MRRRTLKLSGLKMMILDEADEMLNMGFREDIDVILEDLPKERQTLLFSATLSRKSKRLQALSAESGAYRNDSQRNYHPKHRTVLFGSS